MSKDFEDLKRDVIDIGLCVGCGACVGVCYRQALEMRVEDYEREEAEPALSGECVLSEDCACYKVCPGKVVPLHSLDIYTFGRARYPDKESLGVYRKCVNGQTKSRLTRGLSGGDAAISVLLSCALENGIADAAIIFGMDKRYPWRSRSVLVDDPLLVAQCFHSPVTVTPGLDCLYDAVMTRGKKRLAVLGLPCQIHAVRKLQQSGKLADLAQSIAVTISPFCSGKYYYTGMEHWIKEVAGINDPAEILALENWVDQGVFAVTTRDGKTHIHPFKGHGYGSFFSMRDRCQVCVDFSGELADISIGDISQLGGPKKPGWFTALLRTQQGEELANEVIREGVFQVEAHRPIFPANGSCDWEVSKHYHVSVLNEREEYGWPVPSFEYKFDVEVASGNIAK